LPPDVRADDRQDAGGPRRSDV
jgi:hypothetical protein